jgi:2-polyprenyl-6-methoxyphenol hydroxylase-like FAD-dependent oxidoreductase
MTSTTHPTRAVVVGAGIAGLLSARALADYVDEVVVLERERLPDAAEPRGHVPQGKHLHLFLAAGLDQLVDWFPGIDDELEGRGAVRIDGSRAWLFQAGGYRARGDWGTSVISMTRPLLEAVVRRRVGDLANVTIEDGVLVDRLMVSGSTATGVELPDGERRADLVVDASGRSSRLVQQLHSSDVLAPPVSRVSIDCAYASRFLSRSEGDFEGSFIACTPSPPTSFRGGAVLPVEGGRWMVTLSGVHGDVPPTDEQGFRDFAGSLLSPTVGQLLDRCEPTSPIVAYRFPSSQRRHFERAPRLVQRFVVVGDAACSFNPVYGQGMACAALQAAALGESLRSVGLGSPDLPGLFHRRAAKIIDAPWAIAVGADFLHPQTSGPKARGTDLANRYVLNLARATQVSLPLARTFNLVLNLVEPTSVLVRPRTVLRVLRTHRRSPARTGEALVHPWVAPPRPRAPA